MKKLPLLGNITPAEFLRDYWHKKPLLIRGAIPGFDEALKGKEEEGDLEGAFVLERDFGFYQLPPFLDGRVNELERNLRKLSTDFKATQDELNRTKNQNSKKITVLGDMLQFEREQSTENDREWKATKKLLVKEVKNCRSQITALQAERDGYREQNARLRKAVLSNGVSNGSPSKSERDDRY